MYNDAKNNRILKRYHIVVAYVPAVSLDCFVFSNSEH